MKYIGIVILLLACAYSTNDDTKNVYAKKEEIIKLFSSKSVIRNRGQNVVLHTHNGNKKNEYLFEIKNNQLSFLNDSIEYTPDLLMLKTERGTESYKNELLDSVNVLVDKMDELKIGDITSDWMNVGINIKIYMQSQAVILFVKNSSSIKSPRFKDYVKSMTMLDSNWYYSKEDK